MAPHDCTTERAGIVFYILCCMVALLCFGAFALSEALVLQKDTETHVRAIEQAVEQMDKVARK